MNSYLNKIFVIDDPQARIRKDDDLLSAVMVNGQPKLIPLGTQVKITDAKVFKDLVFVRADGFGWTAKNNLKNNFLNETLRTIPPADNDEKGRMPRRAGSALTPVNNFSTTATSITCRVSTKQQGLVSQITRDGFAYDFAIGNYNGDPLYDWLKAHGPAHGFVRTVNGEPWHWEYRPQVAATGAFKIPSVTDDGSH
jgi:hypothetical protein